MKYFYKKLIILEIMQKIYRPQQTLNINHLYLVQYIFLQLFITNILGLTLG